MSINISRLDFTRATAKAIDLKPLVRRIGERAYAVRGSRGWQRVDFSVNGPHRFAHCSCEHGAALCRGRVRVPDGQQHPSACYHVAAALSLHLHFARVQSEGGRVPAFVADPIETERAAVEAARGAARASFDPSSLAGGVAQVAAVEPIVMRPSLRPASLASRDADAVLVKPARAVERFGTIPL